MKYAIVALAVISGASARAIQRRQNLSESLSNGGSTFGFEPAFPVAPKPKPTPSPVVPGRAPSQTLSITGSTFTFAPAFDGGVGRREPQFSGTFTIPAGVNVPPGFLPPGVTLVNAPAGAAATRAPVPPVSQTLGISGSNFGIESAFPAAGAPKPKPTAKAPSPVVPAPVSQTLSLSGSSFTLAPAFDAGVGRREPQLSALPRVTLVPGVNNINIPASTRVPQPSQTLSISDSSFQFNPGFPAASPNPKPTANVPAPVPAPVVPVPSQPQTITPAAGDDDEDAKQEAEDDSEDAKNDHDEEKADAQDEADDRQDELADAQDELADAQDED